MTGTVYTVAPIAPDPEHTTYIDAGAIRIGVEFRILDQAELDANYEGEDKAEIDAAVAGNAVEDNGVSIHVVDATDGHEYLRFDMFEQEPHYHYIEKTEAKQTIVDFDRIAMGPMLPWVLGQLRTRLSTMLEFAGAGELVGRVDQGAVDRSLGHVERMAVEAEEALRASRRA